MAIVETDGLVLRTTDYSETSQIVTLFTRKEGKVAVIAKGARRRSSKFLGALDVMTLGEAVYYKKKGRSLHTLAEFDLKKSYWAIRQDFERILFGSTIVEIVRELTVENDAQPTLFERVIESLDRLEEGREPARVLIRFELVALTLLGLAPRLDGCVECGSAVTDGMVFSHERGGLLCPAHRGLDGKAVPLRSDLMKIIDHLLSDRSDRLRMAPDQRRELLGLFATYVAHQTGRPLRMATWIA